MSSRFRKSRMEPEIKQFEKKILKLKATYILEPKYRKSMKFLIFVIGKGSYHLLHLFDTKLFTRKNILNIIRNPFIYLILSKPTDTEDYVRYESLPFHLLPYEMKVDKKVAKLLAQLYPHIYHEESFRELWGRDIDIIKIVIRKLPDRLIGIVPEECRTEQVIEIAILSCFKSNQDFYNIFYCLTQSHTTNLTFIMKICKKIKSSEILNHLDISMIPYEFYLELVNSGISICYDCWDYILQYPDIMIKSVIISGSLDLLSEEFLTKEICEDAVLGSPSAIRHCPDKLINSKLIELALLSSKGKAYQFIPWEYRKEHKCQVYALSQSVKEVHEHSSNTNRWFPTILKTIQDELKEYKKVVSSFNYFMFGSKINIQVLIKLISQYYDYNKLLESLIIWERAEENLRTFLEYSY